MKVNAQADSVPRGIALDGDLSSPDRLAPAIIPVKYYIQFVLLSLYLVDKAYLNTRIPISLSILTTNISFCSFLHFH